MWTCQDGLGKEKGAGEGDGGGRRAREEEKEAAEEEEGGGEAAWYHLQPKVSAQGQSGGEGNEETGLLGAPQAVGPGLAAPTLNAVAQPRGTTGASPELKSRDHLPPPQPARERCEGRRPVTQPSERALRVSAGEGTAKAAARSREARGSSGPGTGSPMAPSPGSARAWPLHVHAGSAPAKRVRGLRAPEDGRESLTGLRRFSVTFFQSSSCSWCRKPMAGPRSAASTPRPAPLHAPPGPAARRSARHRPHGGGALDCPGPAPRRLRPGGRSSSDSLSHPRPRPRQPPPLKEISALGCPPGGAQARRAQAPPHLRIALGLAAHPAHPAVIPPSQGSSQPASM